PRVRQLERLALNVATPRVAETVANAPNLAGLQSLYVALLRDENEDLTARERLTTLARSPHFAELRELAVGPVLDPDALRAVRHGPAWRRLRKLMLSHWRFFTPEMAAPFRDATLPALEELVVGYLDLGRGLIDHLIDSPLLKQLRHLSLGVFGYDR